MSNAENNLIKDLLEYYECKIPYDMLPNCNYIFVKKGDDLQRYDLYYDDVRKVWCNALPEGVHPFNNYIVPVIRAIGWKS